MTRPVVAAVAALVAATASLAAGAALPPHPIPAAAAALPITAAAAALPTTARMAACPADRAWHAPAGTDVVKIPAAAVRDDQTWTGGWTQVPTSTAPWTALVWDADDWSQSIISAGQGVITYRAEVPVDGTYRWSAKMAAPHETDWNDFWVRFPEGVNQQRHGGVSWAGDGWLKIYSNHGRMSFVWGGGTIDHDPHMLLTRWLAAGSVVEFQISGRSRQVALAAFGLHPCAIDRNGSPECARLDMMQEAATATCY